jgi:ABC-type Zn uptake system ZnuABC Zn-binding protein ZnuA
MSQAAEILAGKFAEIDPASASYFEANARNYQEQLEALDGWIRMQIEEVPPSKRILATSHLAFGYLCRRYGLTAVGVQGLNREDSPPPQKLAEIITYLRDNDVPALFPEVGSNPKALQTVAVEAGIPLGGALYPDGSGLPPGDGYLDMMRANVTAITEGLTATSSRTGGP